MIYTHLKMITWLGFWQKNITNVYSIWWLQSDLCVYYSTLQLILDTLSQDRLTKEIVLDLKICQSNKAPTNLLTEMENGESFLFDNRGEIKSLQLSC